VTKHPANHGMMVPNVVDALLVVHAMVQINSSAEAVHIKLQAAIDAPIALKIITRTRAQ
tara:strand:- start:954 stop:1130 length:177 start_codon:yes stop_codon:yes gene_type:complete